MPVWILFALTSSLCLGFYDIFKKISVRGNNVLVVLLLNTLFGTLYLSPVLAGNLASGHWGLGDTLAGHLLIVVKAVIVLSSWILGYFAIKHLPLTIQGPINATRPVLVLVGALCIFGERLNGLQWAGIIAGFLSLYFISRIGKKEGFTLKRVVVVVDVGRGHGAGSRQRALRQISPSPLFAPRGAGMVFVVSTAAHGRDCGVAFQV